MVSLLILQRTRTESGWLPWTTLVMQMMRGSWLDVFGEEDNQDFWFMDSKLSPPPSPTSAFDFIDSSNLFDNTGDLSDGYKSMPDLDDITDSSDNEEDDIPLLKSFSDSSEDEDDLYGNYKVPETSGKSANIEEEYDSMPELKLDYDDLGDDDSEVGDFFKRVSGWRG